MKHKIVLALSKRNLLKKINTEEGSAELLREKENYVMKEGNTRIAVKNGMKTSGMRWQICVKRLGN